jgi:hypothetical protein
MHLKLGASSQSIADHYYLVHEAGADIKEMKDKECPYPPNLTDINGQLILKQMQRCTRVDSSRTGQL